MIRVGWPEIMAAAEAALASDGQTPSEADRRILRALARGVATVLGSSLHAPGDAPEAAFEEVALVNADGASVTLEPSDAMASGYSLTMPTDNGSAGQALITDGDGVLSWVTGAGAVTSVGDGDGIDCTPNPIVGAGTVAVDATVARRNASNTFAGGTTQEIVDSLTVGTGGTLGLVTAIRDALGDTTTPVAAVRLQNRTAATVPTPVQDSPAVVLEARGWGESTFGSGAANRPYKAAIQLCPNPALSIIPNIEVRFQRDALAWVHGFTLGGPDPFGGIQLSTLFGALTVFGTVEAANSAFALRSLGNVTTATLQRKVGTDDVELRSLAATGKVHLLDGAAAYTQTIMGEMRAYANTFSAGFKSPAALAADRTWTLPLVDGAIDEVMRTNGAGVLSFVPQSGGGGAGSWTRTFAMMGA